MVEEPARVAWRSYHDWVLPMKAVQVLLAGSLLFLFLGLLLLAVGGGVQVAGLIATGAVLAGIGGCGLLVCLLLCLHAYFIFNVRDQANQIPEHPWSDDVHPTHGLAGYAIVNKPSALKSETLRRNGSNGGVKKVTMAPDVALDADVRAPALKTTSGDFVQIHTSPASPDLALVSPASPGYRTLGSYAVIDAAGNSRGVKASGVSGIESFDQRSFAQQHQFQDIQQQKLKHQQASQQAVERQRDDSDIQRQRQQLELHRQHLIQQQQQQQHKHQQPPQYIRVQVQPPPQSQSVTYAQIQRYPIPVQHSPSPSMSSQQSSVFTTGSVSGGAGGGASGFSTVGTGSGMGGGGGGFSTVGTGSSMGGGGGYGAGMGTGSSFGTAGTSSSFGSYKIQTQGLQYQSGRPYVEDDDYDNPAESVPMLAHSPPAMTSSAKGVSFTGSVRNAEADVPEPAPLQHPSERRPMTFEQQSSSKMSIYDNVLFPYAETEGE